MTSTFVSIPRTLVVPCAITFAMLGCSTRREPGPSADEARPLPSSTVPNGHAASSPAPPTSGDAVTPSAPPSTGGAPPSMSAVLPLGVPECAQLSKEANRKKDAFLEVTDLATGTADWRYLTEREAKSLDSSKTALFRTARVARGEKGFVVVMESTSDSGDWHEFAEFCFSPSGALHEFRSEYRSFSGNACSTSGATARVSRQRFDERGERVEVGEEFRCLETLQLLPSERSLPKAEFRTLAELPFASELNRVR